MKQRWVLCVLVLGATFRVSAQPLADTPGPGPLTAAVAALDANADAQSEKIQPRTLCQAPRCDFVWPEGFVYPAEGVPERSAGQTALLGVTLGLTLGALRAGDEPQRAKVGPVRWRDGALIGAGLFAWKGHALFFHHEPRPLGQGRWPDCEGSRDTLPDFDACLRRLLAGRQAGTRGALQTALRRRERFRHVSDITLRATLALPVGFTLRVGSLEPWRDAVAYAEALAVSGGLVSLAKRFAQRPRPFAHFCEPLDAETLGEEDAHASFFSGHTALSFAMASTGWRLAAGRGDRGAGWLKGGGIGLASLTGLLRIAGDMHYLSDVVFGAAVGLGTGWLVAELHEPRLRDGAQAPTTGAAHARDALTPSGMTFGLGRGLHLRAGLVGGGPAFAIQGGF